MKKRLLIPLMALTLFSCNGSNPVSSSKISYDEIVSSSDQINSESSVASSSSSKEESTSSATSSNSSFNDVSSSSQIASSQEESSSAGSSSSIEEEVLQGDLQFKNVSNCEIPLGQYFNAFKGVKVFTQENEDVTSKLSVIGHVDYGRVGEYTLTYKLGTASIERVVKVVNKSISRTGYSGTANTIETKSQGLGSYRSGNGAGLEFAPPSPSFLENDLRDKPIPTTSWWTSLLIANYGGSNGIFTNPLRSSFQTDGVEITNCLDGFTQYWTDLEGALSVAQFSLSNKELMVKPSSITGDYITKVIDYSDNSCKVAMRLNDNDNSSDEMVVTYTQGSPYIFFEQKEKAGSIHLVTAGTTRPYEFYDLNGNSISNSYEGDCIIVKIPSIHVGYNCNVPTTPNSTEVKDGIYRDKYYLVNAPKGTIFTFAQEKHPSADFKDAINYSLGNGSYLSVCALNSLSEADFYHNHGYSFVDRSTTSYSVDHSSSVVETNYNDNYSNVRAIEDKPALALMPHQYKYSDVALMEYTTRTIRGTLKLIEGASFKTKQSFYGMLPTYALPKDETFSASTALDYLKKLDANTNQTYGDTDENRRGPYWDAKTFYPLAQGVIYADQIHNEEYKNKLLQKAEDIIADWFTYSSSSDESYLYYNNDYGTMYYSNNDFNTSSELSDHHFTHGYLIYAFAVCAKYDNTFYQNYKDIAELLTSDYVNPDRSSSMFPFFRSFDAWAGHSWAHGFGSFSEGNNQESSGEALSSWVASYLLGLQEKNDLRIDASIYGFVTEMNSIKQYVFDYDNCNFQDAYSSVEQISAIIWGGKNTYATWFGLNPSFVYGIHYLPLGEYVSSYAIGDSEHSKLASLYQGYLQRKQGFNDTWMANMWSVESLVDVDSALAKFDADKILNDDYPNDLIGAYWNIHANASLGKRTDEVKVVGSSYVGFDVHKVGNDYKVQLWNPTSSSQYVELVDSNGSVIKSVSVAPNLFVTF